MLAGSTVVLKGDAMVVHLAEKKVAVKAARWVASKAAKLDE